MHPRIPCEGTCKAHFGNDCNYSRQRWLLYRLIYRHFGPDVIVLTVWHRGSRMSRYPRVESRWQELCVLYFPVWTMKLAYVGHRVQQSVMSANYAKNCSSVRLPVGHYNGVKCHRDWLCLITLSS
jgi:hypothetical protein